MVRREADLNEALAEASATRSALEQRLAEVEAAHEEAQLRATAGLTAAAVRHAELEKRLSQATAAHARLEERYAAAESAHRDADNQHVTELATLSTRLADAQAQSDAAVKHTESVERQLTETVTALEQARREWKSEVAAAAQRLALRETELGERLAEASAARTAVENKLAEAEAAYQQAQHRAAADMVVAAERRTALEAQVSHERASIGSLQDSLAQVEENGRHAFEASSREIARLQQEIHGLRRQLDTMRTYAAALRRDTERVPALQLQLEESQKENRRLFERAPYGLCECTRDGAISRVNHSMARLLGYRSSAELQRLDLVATAFESADDLRWLIERAVETGKMQSVDTALKTLDVGRLSVRLHAQTTDGSVIIAVEDLTKLSAVEQRLREAQRLEAVGRVASEVAVTCDTLLRDVTRGGRQWLAGFESDTPLRNQGELLLGDVTRAAGFLRQFVAYGHKEISNLEPVSVAHVLRDLEPVLKRVLGNDISLALPKPSEPFEVDVESESVQRILVNVANYARERMPHGGRVKVDLATTVVDQRFLAKHPKVRPGAHVLITITEIQGAIRPELPLQLPIVRATGHDVTRSSSDKPGMDLGPLVALISDLGGHLWMSAEPGGNLTLQIHFPKRTTDEGEAAAPGSRASRGRQFARWFRH